MYIKNTIKDKAEYLYVVKNLPVIVSNPLDFISDKKSNKKIWWHYFISKQV